MSQPLVSVIMPVYNTADYVGASIQSILSQSYKNFELIIINDCSTDASDDVITSFNDKRIKYYRNEENKKIVYCRNKAVEYSSGKYIAMLDSDDISHPDRIKLQVDFLEKNEDYGFIGTFVSQIDSKGNKIVDVKYFLDSEYIRCVLLFKNCFCASAVMFRRDAIIKHQFNPDFPVAEDYEIYLNILKDGWLCGNIDKILTQYRIHGNNITQTKRQLVEDKDIQLLKTQLNIIGLASYTDNAFRYYFLTGKTDDNTYYKEILDYSFDDVNKYLTDIVNATEISKLVNPVKLAKFLYIHWYNSFVAIKIYNLKKYRIVSKSSIFKQLSLYDKTIFFIKCLINYKIA
jgi:glycosyltransferase involved in cell wall biosynthesis